MKVGVSSLNIPPRKSDATLPRHLRRLRHLIRHTKTTVATVATVASSPRIPRPHAEIRRVQRGLAWRKAKVFSMPMIRKA